MQQPKGTGETALKLSVDDFCNEKLSRIISRLKKKVARNPLDSKRLCLLALALYKKGDFDRAQALLERAAKLDSSSFKPHYLLGVIFKERSNMPKAIEEFSQ